MVIILLTLPILTPINICVYMISSSDCCCFKILPSNKREEDTNQFIYLNSQKPESESSFRQFYHKNVLILPPACIFILSVGIFNPDEEKHNKKQSPQEIRFSQPPLQLLYIQKFYISDWEDIIQF
jgi:hypothetical protein